jgi:hypothetical protein
MLWNKRLIILEKKRPTRKNTLISSLDTYIHYLGKTVCGSTHDYPLLKSEFDVNLGLFDDYSTLVDLGYLGMDKNYFSDSITLPHRKPRKSRKNPLTTLNEQQRADNQQHAARRVKIENAISGAKRLGVVTQVYRNKCLAFNDRAMNMACGIWNFHLKARHMTI